MKQIQPVQIWTNGQQQTGSWLGASITSDNLETNACFYWWVSANTDENTSGIMLSSGNLTIAGAEYQSWGQTTDINEAAYTWIAEQLGLTII